MSDTLRRNISYLFSSLGFLGIFLGPVVSIWLGNKYAIADYGKIVWPVLVGFILYLLSYIIYAEPNDSIFEKVVVVFACGSILFSLSALTLSSLRLRYAA
jgi:hypothetical protein